MSKETVGEYLKRERELRQITLEEIAEGTKISVTRLRLIEENKFDDMPAEVFVRGFIRNYAEYIGIDPEEAILRLEEDLKEQERPQVSQEISNTKFHIESKKRSSPLYMVVLVVFLILILAGIYYLFFFEKGTKNPTILGENTSLTIQEDSSKTGEIGANSSPKILLEEEVNDKERPQGKNSTSGGSENSTL